MVVVRYASTLISFLFSASWPRTVSGFASTAGTTASVAFIKKERLYCAHVGDSSVVLGVQECEEREHLVAHPVTVVGSLILYSVNLLINTFQSSAKREHQTL